MEHIWVLDDRVRLMEGLSLPKHYKNTKPRVDIPRIYSRNLSSEMFSLPGVRTKTLILILSVFLLSAIIICLSSSGVMFCVTKYQIQFANVLIPNESLTLHFSGCRPGCQVASRSLTPGQAALTSSVAPAPTCPGPRVQSLMPGLTFVPSLLPVAW